MKILFLNTNRQKILSLTENAKNNVVQGNTKIVVLSRQRYVLYNSLYRTGVRGQDNIGAATATAQKSTWLKGVVSTYLISSLFITADIL